MIYLTHKERGGNKMFEIYVGLKLAMLVLYLIFVIVGISLIGIFSLVKYIGNKKEKELTNETKDSKLKK